MRNIFDQYDAPENQLTHALGCCLQHDRRLLKQFVIWVTGRRNLNWRRLEVLEQQVPGVPQKLLPEDETKGLPDLWIHGDGDWSLIIESKVAAKLTADQLQRHRRTAERNGFADIDLVALVPAAPAQQGARTQYLTWPAVYCWLRKRAKESAWADYMAEFLEVAEVRMTASGYLGDRVLTEFDGIPFGKDHPYSYREAKRLLKLAIATLRQRKDLKKLGMDPTGPGRPAITGRDDAAVWDFVPLKYAQGATVHTKFPHLTLSIHSQCTVVIVTLPSAIAPALRKNMVAGGFDRFRDIVAEVERRVSKVLRKAKLKHAFPHLEVVQRHFPSQRSAPINDANLVFDLRTAVGQKSSAVKHQPQWLEATYNALAEKRSNLQLGIGAVFPYQDDRLHSKQVLDTIAGVWIACDPWIDAILHGP